VKGRQFLLQEPVKGRQFLFQGPMKGKQFLLQEPVKGRQFLLLIRHPSCYSYGQGVFDTTIRE
jgi:hypothetical protein